MANGSLVQIETADKLYLYGYFSPNSNDNSILLHIYGFEGQFKKNIKKLLLLAPFDQKGELVKNNDNLNYLLVKARKAVEIGNGQKITPVSDFGTLGVSYRTYVSWYEQNDFGRMFDFCCKDDDFPILKQIKIPTKIIVGSKDEYFYQRNPEHPEEAMEILLKNIPISEGKIIEGAVHSFSPCEDIMAEEVAKFL
ncbi:hypothetical protein COY91_03180, partial [Candidatus Shapirobacteria bacterium CG_4_10_14_0_8_um_filter_39_15]